MGKQYPHLKDKWPTSKDTASGFKFPCYGPRNSILLDSFVGIWFFKDLATQVWESQSSIPVTGQLPRQLRDEMGAGRGGTEEKVTSSTGLFHQL